MMMFAHMLVTTYLVGLIWTIQVVHYPSFAFVDPEQFVEFHLAHNRWISMIVMVPMLLELGLSGMRALRGGSPRLWVAFACVIGVWAVTFLVIVPVHNRLASGFDRELIERLVATNWIRTAFWTAEWVVLMTIWKRN